MISLLAQLTEANSYGSYGQGSSMSTWPRRCGNRTSERWLELIRRRFIDCEKWRKDFGVDELLQTFDYKERSQVFEYYPQYYHKTDRVWLFGV